MTRTRHAATGALGLAVLAAIVGGVPWALWHYLGWPLPRTIPTPPQVRADLTAPTIPASDLLHALAVAVWAGWAAFTTNVLTETAAALRGGRPRHAPFTPGRRLAAPLITAISIGLLAVLPRSAGAAPGPLTLTSTVQQATQTKADALRPPTGLALDAAARTAPPQAAAVAANTAYQVQARDTLWGIAQAQLGDPRRWREIAALNLGRPQPDGQTFTDPNDIWPGWTLLLPVRPGPRMGTVGDRPVSSPRSPVPDRASGEYPPDLRLPGRAVAPGPGAGAVSPGPAPHPSWPIGSERVPTRVAGGPPTPPAGRHSGPPEHGVIPAGWASGHGWWVTSGLVAGLTSATAAAALRRRRAYRPGDPGDSGSSLRLPPRRPAPTLPAVDPPPVVAWDWQIALGVTSAATEHVVDLLAERGLHLAGPGARGAARSAVLTLIAQARSASPEPTSQRVQLLFTGAAHTLFDGSDRTAFRRLDMFTALRLMHAELDRRQRLRAFEVARGADLNGADPGQSDFDDLRRLLPDEPLPLIVITAGDPSADERVVLTRLAGAGAPVGITVITVASAPEPTGKPNAEDPPAYAPSTPSPWRVHADGALEPALQGAALHRGQLGATDDEGPLRAFILDTAQAAQILTLFDGDDPLVIPREAGTLAPGHPVKPERVAAPENIQTAAPGGQRQPAESSLGGPGAAIGPPPSSAAEAADGAARGDPAAPPVLVTIFGSLKINAGGGAVDRALRAKSRELLAYLACHPAGATADTLTELLWPAAAPDRSRPRLHTAIANIRSTLRAATGLADECFIMLNADRYQLTATVGCDYLAFTGALQHLTAARTIGTTDEAERLILEQAANHYRGELLADAVTDWAEPLRETVRMQALDVLLRLADIHHAAGRAPERVEALMRARTADPYAEEVSRRLMNAHLEAGEQALAARAFRQLEERLHELGVDPDTSTVELLARRGSGTNDRRNLSTIPRR